MLLTLLRIVRRFTAGERGREKNAILDIEI